MFNELTRAIDLTARYLTGLDGERDSKGKRAQWITWGQRLMIWQRTKR